MYFLLTLDFYNPIVLSCRRKNINVYKHNNVSVTCRLTAFLGSNDDKVLNSVKTLGIEAKNLVS